jgi:hypothetical protein
MPAKTLELTDLQRTAVTSWRSAGYDVPEPKAISQLLAASRG